MGQVIGEHQREEGAQGDSHLGLDDHGPIREAILDLEIAQLQEHHGVIGRRPAAA